jgi:hypothetical protein
MNTKEKKGHSFLETWCCVDQEDIVLENTTLWWRRVRCGDRLIETARKVLTDCGGCLLGGNNYKTFGRR